MRSLYLLFFLLAMPALAALGHDIYMAYTGKLPGGSNALQLSDVGWLWTTYEPESFKWARQNADPLLWKGYIDPLLEQTAAIVAAFPAVVVLTLIVLFKMIDMVPGAASAQVRMTRLRNKKGFAFSEAQGKGKGGKARYKRK